MHFNSFQFFFSRFKYVEHEISTSFPFDSKIIDKKSCHYRMLIIFIVKHLTLMEYLNSNKRINNPNSLKFYNNIKILRGSNNNNQRQKFYVHIHVDEHANYYTK